MKAKKKSFILYDDDISCVEHLTTMQAGKLLKALVNLRIYGEVPDLGNDAALKILFQQITSHISINEEKYQQICERNALIARKRWNRKDTEDASAYENVPKDASAYENVPESTKRCYNENENDNKNDYVYDNKNVNVNETENENANVGKNENEPYRAFSLSEAIKKPDFDMSSVESFFASAAAIANQEPHQGSS